MTTHTSCPHLSCPRRVSFMPLYKKIHYLDKTCQRNGRPYKIVSMVNFCHACHTSGCKMLPATRSSGIHNDFFKLKCYPVCINLYIKSCLKRFFSQVPIVCVIVWFTFYILRTKEQTYNILNI